MPARDRQPHIAFPGSEEPAHGRTERTRLVTTDCRDTSSDAYGVSTSTRGACLCGAVTFAIAPPYRWFAHCHCSMCRKHHGSLFGTGLGVARERLRMARRQRRHRSLSRVGGVRAAVLPPLRLDGAGASRTTSAIWHVPAGLLGRRSRRAAAQSDLRRVDARRCYELDDALPQHAAYPPGIDLPIIDDGQRPRRQGGIAGSCLCDGVAFAVAAVPRRVVNCYCSLCRRRSGAAFTSTLLAPTAEFRWLRGEARIRRYALPAPRQYAADFCADCGSAVPSAGAPANPVDAAGRGHRQRAAAVARRAPLRGIEGAVVHDHRRVAAVRGAAAGRAVHGVFSVGCSCSSCSKRSRSSLLSMHSYSRIRSSGRSRNVSLIVHGFVSTAGSSIVAS